MKWKINDSSPIWMQLAEQLQTEIISGGFPPGSRLPSVREFAAEAGVNPNTMQRALSELESRGLIVTNRTAGRNVTGDLEAIQKLRGEKVRQEVLDFLKKMEDLGYSSGEIRSVLEDTMKKKKEEA